MSQLIFSPIKVFTSKWDKTCGDRIVLCAKQGPITSLWTVTGQPLPVLSIHKFEFLPTRSRRDCGSSLPEKVFISAHNTRLWHSNPPPHPPSHRKPSATCSIVPTGLCIWQGLSHAASGQQYICISTLMAHHLAKCIYIQCVVWWMVQEVVSRGHAINGYSLMLASLMLSAKYPRRKILLKWDASYITGSQLKECINFDIGGRLYLNFLQISQRQNSCPLEV